MKVTYKEKAHKQHPSGFKLNPKEVAKAQSAITITNNFGELVDMAPGYAMASEWAGVQGAKKIEVTQGNIRIGSAAVENNEAFSLTQAGNRIDIQIGIGRAIKTLKFVNLKHGSTSVNNTTDLGNLNFKLLVSVKNPQGDFSPLYAVPYVAANGAFPKSFSGASFSNGTLVFTNPLQAEHIRIQFTQNNFPQQVGVHSISASSVSGTYISLPVDITATLEDGSILFNFPGVMPLATSDITTPIVQQCQNVLQKKLDASEALRTEIHFSATASAGGEAWVQLKTLMPKGFLLREFSGIQSYKVEGEAVQLIADTLPLAQETPASAQADIALRYSGIRILSAISDDLPHTLGNLNGSIVHAEPVIQTLPPAAFKEFPLARIGLIGRAAEACELVMEIIDHSGAIPGPVLIKPEPLKLQQNHQLGLHWFHFEKAAPLEQALAIRLRCNKGRFFWLKNSEQKLAFRTAIYDPEPGSEPIYINGSLFLNGSHLPLQEKGHLLPPHYFHTEFPLIDSPLFLTLDIADLKLRYAR